MSDFASLPGHNIRAPVANFPIIPRPPVSPTAAMAAQLAKEITELGDRLSPEQRQNKELQLALLGSQLRLKGQEEEKNAIAIQAAKDERAKQQRIRADASKAINDRSKDDQSNGNQQQPPSNGQIPQQSPSGQTPTTYNFQYYGNQPQQLSAGGQGELPSGDETDQSSQYSATDQPDQTELPS